MTLLAMRRERVGIAKLHRQLKGNNSTRVKTLGIRKLKRLLADLRAGRVADEEGAALEFYTALRAGLQAPPPASAPYVRFMLQLAREEGKLFQRTGGLTILLVRNDATPRPGEESAAPIRMPQQPSSAPKRDRRPPVTAEGACRPAPR